MSRAEFEQFESRFEALQAEVRRMQAPPPQNGGGGEKSVPGQVSVMLGNFAGRVG